MSRQCPRQKVGGAVAPPVPSLVVSPLTWAILALLTPALPAQALDFHPAASYELSGTDPTGISVGDFNGDGLADLALSMAGVSGGDGKISILLADGAGGFTDHPFPVAFRPWGIAAADLNGDERPDLAVTEGNQSGDAVHLFYADGNGFTQRPPLSSGSAFPAAVAIADVNSDGHPDLVVAHAVRPGLSLLRGRAEGQFQAAETITAAVSYIGTDVTLADLNRDGHLDLVVPQAVFSGDGHGGFTFTASLGGEIAVAVADFTGDGLLDVATLTRQAVKLWAGQQNQNKLRFLSEYRLEGQLQAVIALDLNGDGRQDLALTSRSPDQLHLLLGVGEGNLETQPALPLCTEPGPIAHADWNGDGWPDLAVGCRNRGETPQLDLLLQKLSGAAQNGTLHFSRSEYAIDRAAGRVALAVNRVNGDAGSLSANYRTEDGTAIAGEDYQSASGVLTFADGEIRHSMHVELLADPNPEPDEHFQVVLETNPPKVATVVIRDARDPVDPTDPPPVPPPSPNQQAENSGGGSLHLSDLLLLIAALAALRRRLLGRSVRRAHGNYCSSRHWPHYPPTPRT